MKIRKSAVTALATAGVPALVAALAGAPAANAAPASQSAGPAKATALAKRLGPKKTAGVYIDAGTKSPVVNVTNRDAADAVRDAGAKPRIVDYSAKQLSSVKSAIDDAGLVEGTSWSVDPKRNAVTVTTDSTVTRAELHKVKAATERFGDKVTMRKIPGVYRTKITGGDAIFGSGHRCSLGFNVVYNNDPSKHAFLTAGHCGNAEPSWTEDRAGQVALGDTVDSQFPGNDFAIVDYTSGYTDYPSAVGSQPIDSAGAPTVGQTVTRRGSTTGVQDGEVTGLDATVQYQQGTVSGLIKTNVCAEPGDSGGPLYSGSTAYGLTSGGSGDCTSGGQTFFQPVEEALQAYDVTIG
ncbi:MAG: S1 family peptidase [Streptosporangiales bacterium]